MTIVTHILQPLPAVRQAQRKFLAVVFAPLLALRGRVTGRNLSRYGNSSARTIARQFRTFFDWPDFHQRVMRAGLDARSVRGSAQDASVIPKSGKHTFGLGHFFNGGASRAERGLAMATVAVVEVTRRCAFTRAGAQTPPGEGKATCQRTEDEPRMDFDKQQLPDHRPRLPPTVTSPCVDGSFAKKKDSDEVVALKLHPLTKLRYDANCRFL
jgi:hypothetical protein